MAARACALLLLGALSSGNELEDYLWVLADKGQTCTSACQDAGGPCDVTGLRMVTTADLIKRAAVLAGTVCDSPSGATAGWPYSENPAICAEPSCCGDASCQGICTFALPSGESAECDAVGRTRFCSCAVTSTQTSTSTATTVTSTATTTTATSTTRTSSTRTATTVTVSSTTSRTSSSSSSSTASSTTSATSSSSSTSTVSSTTSRTSSSSSTSTVSSTTSRSSTSSSSSTVSSTTSVTSTSTSSMTVSSTTSRTSTSTSSSITSSTTTGTSTSSSSSTKSTSTSRTSTSSTVTSTVSSTTSSSTSRTSTSSSTTSRTSTTSSSTATRTAVVKAGLSPGALVDWVATEQGSLLAGLFSDPARAAVRSESPDARSMAVLLDRTGSAENKVPVAGTAATVAIPASAIEGAREEVAAVVSVFKEEALKKLKGSTAEGASAEMVAAVNVDLATAGGAMEINGLREPVRVGMPGVNSSLKGVVKCAYWHEAKAHWSFEGVTEAWENEELVCKTVHLSLFAAILQGFLNALKCSQLTLLNGEAVRELFRFKWLGTLVALFFWLLVITILCLFVMTCRLDGQRGKTWGDEYFLVPTASADMDKDEKKGEKKGETTLEAEIKEEIKKSEKFANHALRNLVMMSLRKQASATLWYSDQVVDFVCKNKDFEQDMWRVAKDPGPLSDRDAAWRDLHQSVDDCMRDEWKRLGGWVSVSEVASLIFLQVIPVVSVFTWCPFKSSSLRLMLLTCKLFGSLMIGALFFQASGEFLAKSRPQECIQSNLGEKIGRIIAISITSTLLAALPCLILAQVSGRTRKLTKVDAEDVKQAEKKLARWRMVDKAVWCISSLYLAFCTFFILLFIANTNPSDQPAWGVSGLTTLVKDEFLVPLMLSVLLPFLTVAALLKAGKMTTSSGLLAKTLKKFENAGNHGHVYV